MLTSPTLFQGGEKISCFFRISFDIKDHSIEFAENHIVNCAEFLVRASMMYVLFFSVENNFLSSSPALATSISMFYWTLLTLSSYCI